MPPIRSKEQSCSPTLIDLAERKAAQDAGHALIKQRADGRAVGLPDPEQIPIPPSIPSDDVQAYQRIYAQHYSRLIIPRRVQRAPVRALAEPWYRPTRTTSVPQAALPLGDAHIASQGKWSLWILDARELGEADADRGVVKGWNLVHRPGAADWEIKQRKAEYEAGYIAAMSLIARKSQRMES